MCLCPLGVVSSSSSSVLHKAVGFGSNKRVAKWVVIMAAVKPEEISHPPMDQLQGLEYCIDSNPSWGMQLCITSFNLFSNCIVCALFPRYLFFTVSDIYTLNC